MTLSIAGPTNLPMMTCSTNLSIGLIATPRAIKPPIVLNNLPFELYGLPVSDILLWSSMVVSILSGIYYFVQLKDYVLESM